MTVAPREPAREAPRPEPAVRTDPASRTRASTPETAAPGDRTSLLGRSLALAVHPKLTVGAPDDPWERDADRTASRIAGQDPGSAHSAPVRDETVPSGAGLATRIASPASGRPLPDALRGEMQASFGADFTGVRVHDSIQDRGDADALGARAFTYGQHIWLGTGASDTERPLMAHELAHVVQHDGPRPAPDIQGAWYNFSIPGTDYEFDPSWTGVKYAAGLAKDTAVEAVTWIFDKIKGLVEDGLHWLEEQYAAIKDLAVSGFEAIKNGLASLVDLVTSPAALVKAAFAAMDGGALSRAWDALRVVARGLKVGVNAVVDGVLGVANGLWRTVSGGVTRLLDAVDGLVDSWVFRRLPEALQDAAHALVDSVRTKWKEVRDYLTDLLERLNRFVKRIVDAVERFLERVVTRGIQVVIEVVRKIHAAWEFVCEVAADPVAYIQPYVNRWAAKLNAEAPGKAAGFGEQKIREVAATSLDGPNVTVHRQPAATTRTRSRESVSDVIAGFGGAITDAWAKLDIGAMLMETITNMFWPPATIRAIGREFSELWNTDWTNTANELFACRSPLDDFWGWLDDVWANFLILLDFPLALWRRLNNVVMLLMGYVTIILIIIGAVVGGILAAPAGVVPGVIAGAVAGLELAATLGEGVLLSYLYAEGITVVKILLELLTARQTAEQKARDYLQLAASLLGVGVALVMVAIIALLSALVGLVVRAVKGRGVKAADPGVPTKNTPADPGSTLPPDTKPPTQPTEPSGTAKAVRPEERVTEVVGKPNTYRVTDTAALEYSKPSFLKGLKNKATSHWELLVKLPNGEVAVFCEVNVRFRGSPDLNLFPKEAIVKGTGRVVSLEAEGFKWTSESLRLAIESYKANYGAKPANLGGWLAKSNLRNFQNEFARIRAAKPSASVQEIAQEAIASISFGKQRIPLGYEHFHVTMLKTGKVTLADGTTQVVPTLVRVEAGTQPVALPVVPPVPPNAETWVEEHGEAGEEDEE